MPYQQTEEETRLEREALTKQHDAGRHKGIKIMGCPTCQLRDVLRAADAKLPRPTPAQALAARRARTGAKPRRPRFGTSVALGLARIHGLVADNLTAGLTLGTEEARCVTVALVWIKEMCAWRDERLGQ